MKTDFSAPVLVPGPYGYWMLGHVTPYGIQTDIQNFGSLDEGRRWCEQRGIRPRMEVSGSMLTFRQARLLSAVLREGPDTIEAVAHRLKTSIAAAREDAEHLAASGLFDLQTAGRVGLWRMAATASGEAVGQELVAGGV